MARGFIFRFQVEEGLYYPYCEIKGADQLRSYCAADLRLLFSHMQKPGFLITRLNNNLSYFPFWFRAQDIGSDCASCWSLLIFYISKSENSELYLISRAE